MKTIKERIKRNAPTLMIIGNVIGVFVTGGLCVYETIKAVRIVDKLKETIEKPTKKQILKAVAPYYISPAISAAVTIGLGLSSNAVNIKRQQALSAALIASNEAFRAFKEKTVEKIGEEGVKKIVENQAKEAQTQAPKKIAQNADYILAYEKEVMASRDIYPNAGSVLLSGYDLALSKPVLKTALAQMNNYPSTTVLEENKKLVQETIDNPDVSH